MRSALSEWVAGANPLAQASSGKDEAALEGLMWIGGIVILFLLAVVIAVFIKKRAMDEPRATDAMFGLDELRGMRDRGELTIPEYEALRQKTIDAVKGGLDRDEK